jgi:hypothetical protein
LGSRLLRTLYLDFAALRFEEFLQFVEVAAPTDLLILITLWASGAGWSVCADQPHL